MKLSKTRRVIGIAGVALVMLGAVCGTLTLTSHSTHAIGQVSASDIEKYKNNVLYKAFYTNLRSCYVTYMQGGINPSMDGKRSPFNSTTYFTDTGNVLEFPWKFGTGSTTTASCPNMITGWKTSWPASWFTDRGDFSGIKTDIELPGEFGVDDVTKMGEFLTKIGYREESSADGDLSGRKCFYLSANLTQKVRDEYGIYGENRTFETLDFCVKVDDKGLVQPTEDAFVALTGINEYGFCGSNDDSGHLTDSSNIIFVGFNTNTGCTPQFTMNLNNLMFLNANVTEVIPRWNGSSMNYTIQIQQPTSDNCQSLGYEICTRLKGLTIGSVTFEGSLAGGLVMFGGVPVATAYDTIQSRLASVFRGMKDKYGDDVFDNVRVHDYDPKTYSYIKQLDSRGVSTFLKAFLSNPSSYKNGDFTDAEKYVLYWTYLKDYYKVLTRSDEPVGSTSYKVKWLNDDGTFTDTYIYNPQANSTALRNVLSTTTYGELSGLDSITAWSNTKKDWEWIAQQLATIDTDKAFSEEITEIEDPIAPVDPGNNDPVSAAEDPCYKAGAALGWIVCPVVKIVSNTLVGVYDTMIQPFLEIKSSWLTQGSDQSVYGGWSAFRNVANVLFAVLFLVVILSQVTGYGLDNYSVKKILPRLIMVAVLVNISFILCQLAVDVSNILGSALQGFFEGLADKITMPKIDGFALTGKWFSLSGIVSTVLTTLFATGVVAAVVVSWEVWLIPFLLALLGCVIGVIFFFIVLGVRQAGILILVALSPVAIVCYALPNTKMFFDRWKKMFQGLLIVYPICGILIGGGQFASALLIAAGTSGEGLNFFYALVAMLISVVPFFFIPSILRSSMAAMGNIGMKIAGFGSRFSGGVKRAIYNSEGGKEWQRNFNMMNAERTFNRLSKKMEKKGPLGKIDSRRRANAAARYNRLAMENEKAGGNLELMKPGSTAWQNLQTKQLAADTEGQRNLYSTQMNTGDARAVGEEYEKQLEALHANPTDRATLVRVRALQDILSESDPGRSQIRSRMLSVAQRHADEYSRLTHGTDTALSMAAGHLMDNYNGLLKKSNRGTWSMLGHFQGGDFTPLFDREQGRIIGLDSKGQPLEDGAAGAASYTSSFYDQLGLNGYNAMSLIEADDDVRDGINRGITDGSITGANKADIVSLAAEAYGNQNVHFQPKVAKQIRETLIGGNDATTIGGVNAQALKRLAGDISSGTLAGAQRDKLVGMAKTSLSRGYVTNAERAEQLNNILTAAGKEAIPFAGQLNAQDGESRDSGSLPVRGSGIITREGGRTPGGVILPDGKTLDAVGDMLRRDQGIESVRKANERKFKDFKKGK